MSPKFCPVCLDSWERIGRKHCSCKNIVLINLSGTRTTATDINLNLKEKLRREVVELEVCRKEPIVHSQRDAEDSTGTKPPVEKRKKRSFLRRIRIQSYRKDNDGQVCSICLELWTNSGLHRVVSLKCGHLFGKSCIKRWIKSKKKTKARCPECKKTFCKKDIIPLYVKNLMAIDTAERDREVLDLKERIRTLTLQNEDLQIHLHSQQEKKTTELN